MTSGTYSVHTIVIAFRPRSSRKSKNPLSRGVKMPIDKRIVRTICTLLLFVTIGCEAIRCYQCSSNTDQEGEDLCGAYGKFDKEGNIPVECSNEESHTPGTFCIKLTHQSPRGFIWNGRWRQVIRRCASVSSTGVTGVCNWGVYENGIYWQECSCSEDFCNGASSFSSLSTIIFVTSSVLLSILFTR